MFLDVVSLSMKRVLCFQKKQEQRKRFHLRFYICIWLSFSSVLFRIVPLSPSRILYSAVFGNVNPPTPDPQSEREREVESVLALRLSV